MKNQITYTEHNGLYYPNLTLPEQTNYTIGKYGNLRLDFMKKHRRGTCTTLLTEGRLNEHLHAIDIQAHELLDNIFNASQFSDGTLRFICLATLLLQPHELQPATIIVDEPELGLHPYAITIFAEMVKQLSDEKQIIISTQSVELLNEFEADDVIVVDRSENGSVFKRLNSEELEMWLEEDYSLGDLWKKNVLGGRLSK